MAVTAAFLVSWGGGNVVSSTSASVNVLENDWLFIGVAADDETSLGPAAPTVTGLGTTWTAINNQSGFYGGLTYVQLLSFCAQPSADASGTITLTWPQNVHAHTAYASVFRGLAVGNNGLDVVRQTVNAGESGGIITGPTLATPLSDSVVLGVRGTQIDFTSTGGFTTLSGTPSNPNVEWNNGSNLLTPTWTPTTMAAGGLAVAFELGAVPVHVPMARPTKLRIPYYKPKKWETQDRDH